MKHHLPQLCIGQKFSLHAALLHGFKNKLRITRMVGDFKKRNALGIVKGNGANAGSIGKRLLKSARFVGAAHFWDMHPHDELGLIGIVCGFGHDECSRAAHEAPDTIADN